MKIVIHPWMVTELKLSQNELLVFAVVYNYHYKRSEWFNVPRKIIAQWVGITPRAVSKIIKRLSDIGVIEYQVLCNSEVGKYSAFKIPEFIEDFAENYID